MTRPFRWTHVPGPQGKGGPFFLHAQDGAAVRESGFSDPRVPQSDGNGCDARGRNAAGESGSVVRLERLLSRPSVCVLTPQRSSPPISCVSPKDAPCVEEAKRLPAQRGPWAASLPLALLLRARPQRPPGLLTEHPEVTPRLI